MLRLVALVSAALLLGAAPPSARGPREQAPLKRSIRLDDVPSALRRSLGRQALSPRAFEDYIASLDRETKAREQDGEYEHLIYFMLQSQRFTREPRIEPALSAHELVHKLDPEQRALFLAGDEVGLRVATPPAVTRRMADLLRAVESGPHDVRLSYFKGLLTTRRPAPSPSPSPSNQGQENRGASKNQALRFEYLRVMRFLYRKEFLGQGVKDPQQREAFLASLYRERGHSTDTQIEANFGVHTALAVIRASGERRIENVLVVGPGLDFAPRTELIDAFDPQSYQPFALADSLLALGFCSSTALRIHCADINQRVVAYFETLSREQPTRLAIVSGVPARPERPFSPDYREYFAQLGKQLGEERALSVPERLRAHLAKSVSVSPNIARRVTADTMNAVTQRYEPSPAYDLIVVTNVLSYFDAAQHALALTNLHSMLRAGGYLVHNEPQTALVSAAESLGLALVQARTVLIAPGEANALFDRIVIHRKE